MCRNIKTLHNFKPPATAEEIRASSLQFVRKLSGSNRPSKANQPAFDRAVDQVAKAAHELLNLLVTNAPPRHRDVEASKARARAADRFSVGRRPHEIDGAVDDVKTLGKEVTWGHEPVSVQEIISRIHEGPKY